MNVYDRAHELARALRESEEYHDLQEARRQLEADATNREMLLELRRGQWELEEARALGKEVDELKAKRVEQLAELVNHNPTLKNYLTAEYRFARLMADIQKILGDVLTDWSRAAADFFGKDK